MAGSIFHRNHPGRPSFRCAAVFWSRKDSVVPPLSGFGCKVRAFILSELLPCLQRAFVKADLVYLAAEVRCHTHPSVIGVRGLSEIKSHRLSLGTGVWF